MKWQRKPSDSFGWMRGWELHATYSKHFSIDHILERLFRGESLLCVLDEEAGDEVLGGLRDLVELRLVKVVLRPGDIAVGK